MKKDIMGKLSMFLRGGSKHPKKSFYNRFDTGHTPVSSVTPRGASKNTGSDPLDDPGHAPSVDYEGYVQMSSPTKMGPSADGYLQPSQQCKCHVVSGGPANQYETVAQKDSLRPQLKDLAAMKITESCDLHYAKTLHIPPSPATPTQKQHPECQTKESRESGFQIPELRQLLTEILQQLLEELLADRQPESSIGDPPLIDCTSEGTRDLSNHTARLISAVDTDIDIDTVY